MYTEAHQQPEQRHSIATQSRPQTRHKARKTRGAWLHVVTQILNLGGPNAELIEHREKPWSSATFNGNCHYITLCFNGPEAIKEGQRFAQSIPEHEYSIPRHIVAESRVHSATYNTTPAPSAQLEIHVLLLEIA